MSPNRRPKSQVRPGTQEKGPKTLIAAPATPVAAGFPRISFRYADRGYRGAWTWPEGPEAAELLNFLCDISSSKWGELLNQTTGSKHNRHHRNHAMPLDSVCEEAQQRLLDLHHNQTFEELFRFRITTLKRLWGFRVDDDFFVLWWDSDHQVYPTEP